MHTFPSETWEKDELYAYNDNTAQYLMACNGWVMNANPLIDFAAYPSQVIKYFFILVGKNISIISLF